MDVTIKTSKPTDLQIPEQTSVVLHFPGHNLPSASELDKLIELLLMLRARADVNSVGGILPLEIELTIKKLSIETIPTL